MKNIYLCKLNNYNEDKFESKYIVFEIRVQI